MKPIICITASFGFIIFVDTGQGVNYTTYGKKYHLRVRPATYRFRRAGKALLLFQSSRSKRWDTARQVNYQAQNDAD